MSESQVKIASRTPRPGAGLELTSGSGGFAYGMRPVVIFNALLIHGFAIGFVNPKERGEWRSMGLFIGFVVALFTEIYGLPLTIYFLTQWLGAFYPVINPFSHDHGHLWLVGPGLFLMTVGFPFNGRPRSPC